MYDHITYRYEGNLVASYTCQHHGIFDRYDTFGTMTVPQDWHRTIY